MVLHHIKGNNPIIHGEKGENEFPVLTFKVENQLT